MKKRNVFWTAKLNVPRLPKVVPRMRLFRFLDKSLKHHPILWIHGPPGSGKTTLVTSYLKHKKLRPLWYQVDAGDVDVGTFFHYLTLAGQQLAPRMRRPLPQFTPEALHALASFAQPFFEQLYQRLKSPTIFVLDNYQEAATGRTFHQVVEGACMALPHGIHVLVISREAPPENFATWPQTRKIARLDQEALRLTLAETQAVVALIQRKGAVPLSKPGIHALHQQMEGWMAGVVLTLHAREQNQEIRQQKKAAGSPTQLVFNYLSNEVFRTLPSLMQAVLLKTSVVPQITPAMALELSGVERAPAMLEHLYRERYFMERQTHPSYHVVYQYHPMFHDFLRLLARERMSSQEWCFLNTKAGQLLEEAGQPESALEQYFLAAREEDQIRLICQEAPKLMEQGRNQTIDQWVERLPDEKKNSDPWLLYWKATCALGTNVQEAVSRFEIAFHAFRKTGHYEGMGLAWSGWVDAISMQYMNLAQLNALIALYDECFPVGYEFNDLLVCNRVTFAQFHAGLWVQPDYQKMVDLWKRCVKIFHKERVPNQMANQLFALNVYNLRQGTYKSNFDLIEYVENKIDQKVVTPYCLGIMALMRSFYFWQKGEGHKVLREVEEVDQIVKENGVVGGQLQQNRSTKVYGAILIKDYELAQVVLEENDRILTHAPSTIRGYHHFQVGWVAWLQGDTFRAKGEIEIALASAYELCGVFEIALNHLCASIVHQELRLLDQAAEHLAKGMPHAQYMQSPLLLFMGHLVAAAIAYTRKDEAGGREALAQAMEWGRVYTFVEFPYFHPRWMARLCVYALEAGIEVEYVRYLIQRRDLVPETPPVHLEDWPWPVRISTLGTFAIEVRGQRVSFPRKMQKRTLAFLKALVCATQREVALETVLDWLWPESEGDHAYNALTTTIHRARKLIGDEQAIVIQDGKIGFNAQRVWVDSWAMKEQLVRADEAAARGETATAEQWLTRAVQQYRGSFLPEDEAEPWTTAMREKLRRQYGHALARLRVRNDVP
ncbi:hypothetical protein [Candidatus Nitronereus thalassa]|uniref:Bacterial transcriptional activator domain-containing protein n=1 Tax=Candidatus Nitronereus thalassa TaxID=3020898 RepID=A0ABU3K489_9BACT|nr:hypothetical protein [Candidatus Nitronereus thalassa]MDT7041219.1 hypothetical protein [Candidatus Nitronereus thalassa]